MMPSIVFEAIAGDSVMNSLGIDGTRIFELQSIENDERPFNTGYALVVDWQESTLYSQTYAGLANGIPKAPRVMQVWVHVLWDESREYRPLDRILNRVDDILLPMEQAIGTDGVRVTVIRPAGRSRNLTDPAWKTITRNATYGVLYDERAA
jgi:hypothetical protein